MIYNTIHPPPPQPPIATHHLYLQYSTFSLRRGGGGKVREKVEGQQYTSIILASMGATDHKLGQKYQP
jgi:hypothetical protein